MAKIAVIGIGNPLRGDDGAGWAVIDAIDGKVSDQIKLCKSHGDFGEILEYFSTFSTVYLIDACRGDALAGLWQRMEGSCDFLSLERAQTSTHGLSICQAISLAKALNQLPFKLIIYAINADHYNVGSGLSSPVIEAIPAVVQSLLNEEDIRKCTKKA